MFRWELDELAQSVFDALDERIRLLLAEFMDAVVLVGPIEYQRHSGERSDLPAPLRTLHFGPRHQGLATFLVYPPDDVVLVVRIQWMGA
jgi:hypothetical protein